MILDTGTSIQAMGSADLFALVIIMNDIGNVNCRYSEYRFVILEPILRFNVMRSTSSSTYSTTLMGQYLHSVISSSLLFKMD